jgi:hypothetical protein
MADEDKHNLSKSEGTDIDIALYKLILDSDNKISHSVKNDTLGGTVYKYDLSNKTIEKENFTHSEVFNEDKLASKLPNTFIFAQGSSMYCTESTEHNECFVDKATINQMLEQAGSDKIAND